MRRAVQICFFAHSPEEVRHPATKPFVPPEALAAATTSATLEAVRKAAADSDASKKEVRRWPRPAQQQRGCADAGCSAAPHPMPCCWRHASLLVQQALRLLCGLGLLGRS